MQDVPKIVRQRLEAGVSAGSHLDANVMTAFAERSLPEFERTFVIEHLSRCGECRDVLALALPETEVQTEVQPVIMPTRGGWFTWPVLRWGFAAAGIVAIASIGIVQYQRRQVTPMIARESLHSESTVAQSVQTPPNASLAAQIPAAQIPEARDKSQSQITLISPNPTHAPGEQKSIPPADSSQLARNVQTSGVSIARSAHSFASAAPSYGPNMQTQSQQGQSQQAQQRSSQVQAFIPGPATKQQRANVNVQTGSVAGAVAEVPKTTADAAVDANLTETTDTSAQKDQFNGQAYELSRAKPSVTTQAAPVPRAATAMNVSVTGANVASVPLWTISASGRLQRSFDQGASWEDVNVNTAALSPPANFTNAQTLRGPLAKVDSAATNIKKVQPAATVFRAVSANGADVWAGGSNGVLYHTADAGNHWIRVVPASGGMTPMGDIVTVEFSDAQHGRITTSTSETWTTGDGGQSWQKQ